MDLGLELRECIIQLGRASMTPHGRESIVEGPEQSKPIAVASGAKRAPSGGRGAAG
jgi:hypothetical protein